MTDSKIIQPLGNGKKKILSPAEAMAQIEAYQPPKPAEQGSAEQSSTAHKPLDERLEFMECAKVEWEHSIAKHPKTERSILLRYDQHQGRFGTSRFKPERAPSPEELFSLLTLYYEGKLDALFPFAWAKSLAEDILSGQKLYTCHFCSFEQKVSRFSTVSNPIEKMVLNVFEFITDAKWDSPLQRYFSPKTWASHNKTTFDITGIIPYNTYELKSVDLLNQDLVAYLFGRNFKDLPEQLQSLNFTINITEGIVSPLIFDADTKTVGVYHPETKARSLGVSLIYRCE